MPEDAHVGEDAIAVDVELRTLLPALDHAAAGRVLALVQGRSLEYVGLIPFLLHARWPDALPWLPLTASASVLPFRSVDLVAGTMPSYRVGDVRAVRRTARWARYEAKRDQKDDFMHADWEEGAKRLREQLDDLDLPPHSFVSIERVLTNGTTSRVSRPVLGRHAERHATRPRVLIPSARTLSAQAAATLAGTDLMVVNLQGLRGQRTLRTVQAVLKVRQPDRPTLLVAASVSDLLAAGLEEPRELQVIIVGTPTTIEAVTVVPIAQDRLSADERFHSALAGVADDVPSSAHIIGLAESAWWAIRQSVDVEGGQRELQRFQHALDDVAREDPMAAGLLTACRDLLVSAASNVDFRDERRRAAVEACLQSRGFGKVLVLTRSWKDATTLRVAIATELHTDDLEKVGVWVRGVHTSLPRTSFDAVVLVGYAGMVTLDAALATIAPDMWAVFDPVETRVAWYNACRMADYLDQAKAPQAAAPLHRIADNLASHVVGFAHLQEILVDASPAAARDPGTPPFVDRPASDAAVVVLLDGTTLEVPLGTRFEVMGRHGRGSQVVPVASLEQGDQIVLLDDEVRTLFSEQRMATLDADVLKEQSRARANWLAMVHAVAEVKRLSPAAIARSLTRRGYRISDAAVRGWLSERADERHVPMRIEHFLALADLLGINLPQETLQDYYYKIKTWRVQHRRAGHEVARAIRLAYAGRLGPITLARIEHDWGVGVRALIDAAWVGEVDEILLPEVVMDAGDASD